MRRLQEPLESSATLAWQLAPQLCRTDSATGESCAGIHGFWQYLRLLGLASTPQDHAEFYRRAFLASGEATAPRVLVSGAADYSMLAHVLAIYRERGIEPAVTVLDACETPLSLNRWYAARASAEVEHACCDILDFAAPAPFDLVCTHSFLVQFPPNARKRLVAKWREILRPGGIVATVTRVRPQANAARSGFSPQQARAFCDAVLRKAEAMRQVLHLDPAQLAQAAER